MPDPVDGSIPDSQDTLETDAADLTASLDQAEERLWKRHRIVWWATLVGTVLLTIALLAAIYIITGAAFTQRLLTTALSGLFLFGRFIILAGHDPEVAKVTGSLSSPQLFAMVTYLDLIVGGTLIFHTGFLFHLPWFGSRATAFVNDGRFLIRSHP